MTKKQPASPKVPDNEEKLWISIIVTADEQENSLYSGPVPPGFSDLEKDVLIRLANHETVSRRAKKSMIARISVYLHGVVQTLYLQDKTLLPPGIFLESVLKLKGDIKHGDPY